MAQAFAERSGPASDSVEVSPELAGILRELNQAVGLAQMVRRAELCRRALTLVSLEHQPMLWAALQVELGNSLAQSLTRGL